MPKFSAPLDLSRAELRNAVTQNLGTAPSSPVAGLRYYDTVSNKEAYWNGTKWVVLADTIDASGITGLGDLAMLDQVGATEIAPGVITNAHISPTAAIDLAKLAVDPLARANHTGTQLAATISDFDTQVRTNRLDQMAIPTATIDLGGQVITNSASPTLATDLTNKAYVDSIASGTDVHTACRAGTTANIDLASAPAVIDGVTLAASDRVCVKNQTDATQNGIYVFSAAGAAMTRAADADVDGELKNGTYVLITTGTVNMNSGWIVTTPNPIDIGVDNIAWVQFSAGGSQYVGTANRITVTGTQIDIAATYVGQASITTVGTVTSGVWNGTPVDIAHGGTGATDAAGARAALQTLGKYTGSIGDGSALTYTITHNLNSLAVGVELYEIATGQTVYADVRRTSVNAVVVEGFVSAPATGAIGVVVWG
jgi:hypothetical protein